MKCGSDSEVSKKVLLNTGVLYNFVLIIADQKLGGGRTRNEPTLVAGYSGRFTSVVIASLPVFD